MIFWSPIKSSIFRGKRNNSIPFFFIRSICFEYNNETITSIQRILSVWIYLKNLLISIRICRVSSFEINLALLPLFYFYKNTTLVNLLVLDIFSWICQSILQSILSVTCVLHVLTTVTDCFYCKCFFIYMYIYKILSTIRMAYDGNIITSNTFSQTIWSANENLLLLNVFSMHILQ